MNSWNILQTQGCATPTDNAAAAPNGTTTATQVVEIAGGGNHQFNNIIGSQPNATTFTYSHFLKANGRTKIMMDMSDSTTGDASALIDLTTNGITIGPKSPGNWTNQSASVEDYANGWKRCTLTATATPGGVFDLIPRVQMCNAAGSPSYVGDGVSGVFAWGAQVEVASFATSYIPTTGTSATRAADNVQFSGLASTITAGTVASLIMQSNRGIAGIYATIIRTNVAASMLVFRTDNLIQTEAAVFLITSNAANRVSRDKYGISWDAISASLVLNAGTVATQGNPNTIFTAPFGFGSIYGTGSALNGYFERLTIWNSRLADATLQSLTDPNITSGFPNTGATIDMDFTTSRYYSSLEALAPVGWWPFDGYASPETDLSSGGHNATLTGTARVLGPGIVARATGS